MIDISTTGHRQPRLFEEEPYSRKNMVYLYKFAIQAISESVEELGLIKEEIRFRNGLAGGWDLACAGALQTLGIPYIATIPFRGQESRWRDKWLRDFYNKSLDMAEEVKCDPVWLQKGLKVAYILRDHDMVDCSQKMLGLWNGAMNGGTFQTYSYAQKKLGPGNCTNLWEKWEQYKLENPKNIFILYLN